MVLATLVASASLGLGLSPSHVPAIRTNVRRADVRLADPSLFASDMWKQLELELSTVPVFMLVNQEGAPLQVQGGSGTMCTVYFADTVEAEGARVSMLHQVPSLDITPSSLAAAYKAQRGGTGVLVPSKANLAAAGMEDAAASSDVPMFACMDLVTTRPDGTDCIPLFMCNEDAEGAVQHTIKHMLTAPAPGFKVPQMKVSVLSLNKAVDACLRGTHNFRFVPSTRAMEQLAATRALSHESGQKSLAERSAVAPGENASAEG